LDVSTGLQLLIVTNDPVLAARVRKLEMPGVAVDMSTQTSEALMLLESGRYSAILADQVLEGALCGHDFLLAAQQVDTEVTTVLLTDRDRTAEPGFDRFDLVVPRSTSAQKLLARILIRREGAALGVG
jgi:DNA-binding response OmpR family regulator